MRNVAAAPEAVNPSFPQVSGTYAQVSERGNKE